MSQKHNSDDRTKPSRSRLSPESSKTFLFLFLVCLNSPAFAASQSGIASIYCDKHTASREQMNCGAYTAAHRSIPFGTHVTVSNKNRSITVRINDRGPFIRGRIIDLSPAAARALRIDGLGHVTISW